MLYDGECPCGAARDCMSLDSELFGVTCIHNPSYVCTCKRCLRVLANLSYNTSLYVQKQAKLKQSTDDSFNYHDVFHLEPIDESDYLRLG